VAFLVPTKRTEIVIRTHKARRCDSKQVTDCGSSAENWQPPEAAIRDEERAVARQCAEVKDE
jgi:hypothetical protein